MRPLVVSFGYQSPLFGDFISLYSITTIRRVLVWSAASSW